MGYPFDVFGVGADADEKSLKRAYAALVRQHRPDKDPEGFARVQAAYERALAIRQAQSWSSEHSSAPERDDDFLGRLESLEVTRTPPGEGQAPTERRDFDFSVEFAPPVTLEELMSRVGEERAARLVNEATDGLLLAGRGSYLWRELTSAATDRLLLAERSIEPALLKTSAFFAYASPRKAKALLDRVRLESGELRWLEDRALLALDFGQGFRDAGGASFPQELRRLVRLLPIVDPRHCQGLVDEASSFAWDYPEEFLNAVSDLDSSLLDALGHDALAKVGSDDEPEPAVQERALQDRLAVLDSTVESYEDSRVSFRTWVAVAVVVGIGGTLMLGLAVAGSLLVGSFLVGQAFRGAFGGLARMEERKTAMRYAAKIRELMLQLTLETGAAPDALARVIGRSPLTGNLRPYGPLIREDETLLFAHRLAICAGPNARPVDDDAG